jgi:hypothetical protein
LESKAVETIFYFFRRPGQPIDWQQVPKHVDGMQAKSWQTFYASCNELPSHFSSTVKLPISDEVNSQLKRMSELILQEEQEKKPENAKIDEKKSALIKIDESQDDRNLFNSRNSETAIETLRRRIDVLQHAFNEFDGYKSILSEDDLKKHDNMINTESKEDRRKLNKRIFVVRQKATCLILAYSMAAEQLEREETLTWDTLCYDVSVQLGLAPYLQGHRIMEFNVEFREKEIFPLGDPSIGCHP